MAAYGPEDFVFGDFNFDDFSDFSDISEDEFETAVNVDIGDDGEEDDGREFCFCKGLPTKEMIACEGPNCSTEWFHYTCVGLTAATIPDGNWFCSNCDPSFSTSSVTDEGEYLILLSCLYISGRSFICLVTG